MWPAGWPSNPSVCDRLGTSGPGSSAQSSIISNVNVSNRVRRGSSTASQYQRLPVHAPTRAERWRRNLSSRQPGGPGRVVGKGQSGSPRGASDRDRVRSVLEEAQQGSARGLSAYTSPQRGSGRASTTSNGAAVPCALCHGSRCSSPSGAFSHTAAPFRAAMPHSPIFKRLPPPMVRAPALGSPRDAALSRAVSRAECGGFCGG